MGRKKANWYDLWKV